MMMRYSISLDPFVSGKAPPAARRTAYNLGLRDATVGIAGPERSDQNTSERGNEFHG
jgi:hypothetical protein